MRGQIAGPNTVEFKDGQKIVFHYNSLDLQGMLYGKRLFLLDGTMTIEDPVNDLLAEINFPVKPVNGVSNAIV